MLLFCTEADVIWNFATEHVPELLVSDNTTTRFLHSVRLVNEGRIQEAVHRDEKSVSVLWLKSEDPLTDGTRVQALFAPQVIQKFEVGEMEKNLRPRTGRGGALHR